MWAPLSDDDNDGSRGATYAQTASETAEGCKLNGVHSLWVYNTWFCDWGLKLRQRLYTRVMKWIFL
jgi:hypothetical protein